MTLQQSKLLIFPLLFFFPQFISSQVTNVYNINGCNELSEQIFIECIYNNSSKSNDEIIKFIGQEFIQKGFYDFKILNFLVNKNRFYRLRRNLLFQGCFLKKMIICMIR